MSTIQRIDRLSKSTLGLYPSTTGVEAMASALGKVSPRRRRGLLAKVSALLQREGYCRNQEERIAGAKVLVAFLPESLELIGKYLEARTDQWDHEFHFSLFCFLDDSQFLPIPPTTIRTICDLVVEYLASVRQETAAAAWMAGHLLGDHWKGKEALEGLKNVALRGRYAAGRKSAVGGLEEWLAKSNKNEKAEIIRVLNQISIDDHSPRIRSLATSMISRKSK